MFCAGLSRQDPTAVQPVRQPAPEFAVGSVSRGTVPVRGGDPDRPLAPEG
jgi:hypothetical protein